MKTLLSLSHWILIQISDSQWCLRNLFHLQRLEFSSPANQVIKSAYLPQKEHAFPLWYRGYNARAGQQAGTGPERYPPFCKTKQPAIILFVSR